MWLIVKGRSVSIPLLENKVFAPIRSRIAIFGEVFFWRARKGLFRLPLQRRNRNRKEQEVRGKLKSWREITEKGFYSPFLFSPPPCERRGRMEGVSPRPFSFPSPFRILCFSPFSSLPHFPLPTCKVTSKYGSCPLSQILFGKIWNEFRQLHLSQMNM